METISKDKITNELLESFRIRIISGEGDYGKAETYEGKYTLRALQLRLAKERCHGDRWARAEICTGIGMDAMEIWYRLEA